jgi:hypothetical protein
MRALCKTKAGRLLVEAEVTYPEASAYQNKNKKETVLSDGESNPGLLRTV